MERMEENMTVTKMCDLVENEEERKGNHQDSDSLV